MKRLCVLISYTIWLLISLPSIAYDITIFDVKEQDKKYDVRFSVEVDIPSEILLDYIKDIENIGLIIPSVEKFSVINNSQDETQVNAVMKPCIMVVCKRIYKYSIVEFQENGLTFNGLPNKGSFTFIDESLYVSTINEKTSAINYQSNFSPSFYMPAFLGVLIMKQSMKKYLVLFLEALELKHSQRLLADPKN